MPDDLQVPGDGPHHHRAGAWLVLVVGGAGMLLGLWQWREQFSQAFAVTGPRFKTAEQQERERIEELKKKDTDFDGLSDFEETYVYRTSPYLDDSDSDERKDRDELADGTNPNCPEGKTCDAFSAEGGLTLTSAATSTFEDFGEDVMEQLLNPTPADIRALLLDSGVTAAELEGIDDATLLELYRQSLQEAQVQASAGG